MAAREHRKTHNVEPTEKMIPLITGEIGFRQQISELVFRVNIFDSDLWSKLILSNNQSCATHTKN